jgi:hypothetical protein
MLDIATTVWMGRKTEETEVGYRELENSCNNYSLASQRGLHGMGEEIEHTLKFALPKIMAPDAIS